ncbi:Six-hairpin glycosidase-like protein [Xylogone sp. PMI_703]|nr:Six-hairpin glycosidase-like protein [Xylogone sp. PMI_703]
MKPNAVAALSGALLLLLEPVSGKINREKVVTSFNPVRHASSNSTPAQVGNGNFAFGADVTGLQTFLPYAIMSSWGWHNFSLPTTVNQTSPSDFTGLDWWTHGRLVNYDQPNPAENDISNWLIQNPQRLNLGRLGLSFNKNGQLDVTEEDILHAVQTVDLYSGTITSQFTYQGSPVKVQTWVDPHSDTVAVSVQSELIRRGQLGIFFDYPYPDVNKFDAPFVGVWNQTDLHTTSLQKLGSQNAKIKHQIDETVYYTSVQWQGRASISGPLHSPHRYILQPSRNAGSSLQFTTNFSPTGRQPSSSVSNIAASSKSWWKNYWSTGGFIDLTSTKGRSAANATEIQRRIILSQYLLAINEAGAFSPQESGLVNNGWYGKFHMEMVLWHLAHWARWGKWDLLSRSVPGIYNAFLDTSIQRAKDQGYAGARWGKMSDPTGRSAPGEINSLLIWQQPHPFFFAEVEWKEFGTREVLRKWDTLLTETAEFMTSFAWWNTSTGVYDLGPPMYPVSENTNPNATINPTFELAYWRFGLGIATKWKQRQHLPVPSSWTHVLQNLAPLPIDNATQTYSLYEGISNMWVDPTTYQDHPAMIGIYGLLPPPTDGFDLNILRNTAAKIKEIWDFPYSFGWDFPMLAMNSARLGEIDDAVNYLLHPSFQFDDMGMQVGGSRVPTPYFPGASSLLLAAAFLAGGWDGMHGKAPVFPSGWKVQVEGFSPAL